MNRGHLLAIGWLQYNLAGICSSLPKSRDTLHEPRSQLVLIEPFDSSFRVQILNEPWRLNSPLISWLCVVGGSGRGKRKEWEGEKLVQFCHSVPDLWVKGFSFHNYQSGTFIQYWTHYKETSLSPPIPCCFNHFPAKYEAYMQKAKINTAPCPMMRVWSNLQLLEQELNTKKTHTFNSGIFPPLAFTITPVS